MICLDHQSANAKYAHHTKTHMQTYIQCIYIIYIITSSAAKVNTQRAIYKGNPLVTSWFPSQRASNANSLHDVIIFMRINPIPAALFRRNFLEPEAHIPPQRTQWPVYCRIHGQYYAYRWPGDTKSQGPVLLTFLRHVARISANGIAAFKESCSPIG